MTHPTTGELQQFLRGGLRPSRVREVADHLRECGQCAGAAIDPEHPSLEEELTPYANGRLHSPRIAAHLETCSICREDVDDIRRAAALLAPERRRRRWPYLVAAAAVLAAISLTALLLRDGAPPPVERRASSPPTSSGGLKARRSTTPSPMRAEWKAAIDRALRDGSLAMPAALAELQLAADPERAPSSAKPQTLAPAGAIVETTRPLFQWTPVRGASYTVTVLDEHLEPVLESPPLRVPRWQPERELARGRVYQWQVAVDAGGATSLIPSPPAPPAVFHVLDADAHAELERARAEHGGDPLLLGVLYARHGLRDEALRELAKVDTDAGRRLLRSVEAW